MRSVPDNHLPSLHLSHALSLLPFIDTVENEVPVDEDAIVAGVEFSFPHNIVDSGILEPLRILSETTGISVGADALEYLSYGLQMHLTTVLEACMKSSMKRRNIAGIKKFTSSYDKIVVRGEKPDPKATLGIIWGPNVASLLNDQETAAREELKIREAEEEVHIVKEIKSHDDEKRANAVLGNKRGRGSQIETVEAPWWVKEVRFLSPVNHLL